MSLDNAYICPQYYNFKKHNFIMRQILLLFALMVFSWSVQGQTQLLNETFNGTSGTALPVDWSQSGNGWKSGTTATLNSTYFAISKAYDGRFIMINDDKDNTNYNDQLLKTAPLDLTNETDVYVSFRYVYFNGSYEGKQEVLTFEASRDSGATWEVISEVPSVVSAEWEKLFFSAKDFEGSENVMFGLRYSDNGGWLFGAAIDNFEVIVPAKYDASLDAVNPAPGSYEAYVQTGTDVNFKGTIFNNGLTPITSISISYQVDSGDVKSSDIDVDIPTLSSGEFSHDIPLLVDDPGGYDIRIWVDLPDDADKSNDTLTTKLIAYKTAVTKRLLIEEATGTWCGWCPRGTYGMELFAENNPGAAAQVAVHNQDPMAVTNYNAIIGTFISGYPSMVVDRRIVGDPGETSDLYEANKGNFGFANIEMGELVIEDTKVTIPVSVTPSIDVSGYKLAIVVTESNLRGPAGTNWDQVNYYSGLGVSLGGWESEADPVPNTFYHFVGRYIGPNVNGSASGLPADMIAGETYETTMSANLNINWKKHNLQYIILLFNSNNEVVNTAFTELPELRGALSDVAGTSAVKPLEGIEKMMLYPNPVNDQAFISLNLTDALNATIAVTDVLGNVVYRKPVRMNSGENTYQLNTSVLKSGVYFATIHTQKGQTTMMFVKQ